MTAPIPTTEPVSFAAGETLIWRKSLASYPPSDGWTLKYQFRSPAGGFDVTAAADGNGHRVTVAATTTEPLNAAIYHWRAFAEHADGTRFLVGTGRTEVSAAYPDADVAVDGRSTARKILDAIDAMALGKASLDQQKYMIGNRSLDRIPIPELLALRTRYAQLVARENLAERKRRGLPFFKNIYSRFSQS